MRLSCGVRRRRLGLSPALHSMTPGNPRDVGVVSAEIRNGQISCHLTSPRLLIQWIVNMFALTAILLANTIISDKKSLRCLPLNVSSRLCIFRRPSPWRTIPQHVSKSLEGEGSHSLILHLAFPPTHTHTEFFTLPE